MTTDHTLLRLALATKECPLDSIPPMMCQDCSGTGRAPLLPGLRAECTHCKGEGYHRGFIYGEAGARVACENCGGKKGIDSIQGRGWTVTTKAETITGELWRVLAEVESHTDNERVINHIAQYEHLFVIGHFAQAFAAAAQALEEAGILKGGVMHRTDTDTVLLRLAEATTECPQPECPEKKHMGFEDIRPVCGACGGTSRVPLVEGIREECPNCKGSGKECSCGFPLRGEDSLPCGDVLPCHVCQGRRWFVTTNSETITRRLWAILQGFCRGWCCPKLAQFLDAYEIARIAGYDADAWRAAACALAEAGLLEKEKP